MAAFYRIFLSQQHNSHKTLDSSSVETFALLLFGGQQLCYKTHVLTHVQVQSLKGIVYLRLVFTLEFLGKLSAYAKIQKVPGHFQHLKILILRCLKMKTHKHCAPTLKELMIDFEVHKNKQCTLYSASKTSYMSI